MRLTKTKKTTPVVLVPLYASVTAVTRLARAGTQYTKPDSDRRTADMSSDLVIRRNLGLGLVYPAMWRPTRRGLAKRRTLSVLGVAAVVCFALPAAASAQRQSSTGYGQSSTSRLSVRGARTLQYDLLRSNSYFYTRPVGRCRRIARGAIRCRWTRGATPTDQAQRTYNWVCLTNKKRVRRGVYSYRTGCILLTGA